jgi:hypothetical protein
VTGVLALSNENIEIVDLEKLIAQGVSA